LNGIVLLVVLNIKVLKLYSEYCYLCLLMKYMLPKN